MKNSIIIRIAIYLTSIFTIILLVQLLSYGVNNIIILPSVSSIFKSFFGLVFTGKTYLYVGNTIKHLIISLGISFIVGVVLGVLAGLFKYVRLFLKPWMTLLRSIPLASTLVIFMILVGLSKTPYYVCCIMLIPIIYESTCQGILNINSELMDVWRLHSRISFRVVTKVHIPLILPYIKSAFISSVGMGIKVIIMAEYLAGSRNTLGSAILPAANMLDYSDVYGYSIIMVLLVILLEQTPKLFIKIYNYFKFSIVQRNKKKIK